MKKHTWLICCVLVCKISLSQSLPSLIPYRINDKWGYVDGNLKIIIPIKYHSAQLIRDNTMELKLQSISFEDTYEYDGETFKLKKSVKKSLEIKPKETPASYDNDDFIIEHRSGDTVVVESSSWGSPDIKICSTSNHRYFMKINNKLVYDDYDFITYKENRVILKKGEIQFYVGDFKGNILFLFKSNYFHKELVTPKYFPTVTNQEGANIIEFETGKALFKNNKYGNIRLILKESYDSQHLSSYSDQMGLFEVYKDYYCKFFLGYIDTYGNKYWKN